jgi:phosphatidate cytidylyltransferase
MLKQRVLTAIVLVGLLIGALLYLPPLMLAGFFGLFLLIGGWEWAALAGLRDGPSKMAYVAMLLVSLLAIARYCDLFGQMDRDAVKPILLAGGVWWCFALLWVKTYPMSAKLWGGRFVRAAMGFFVLVPAWLGLVALRQFEQGVEWIFYVMLAVSCADIGAYFTGRKFGRRKLAPQVSPGKTIEGLLGGIVLSAAYATGFFLLVQPAGVSLPALLLITLIVALVSVLGDLLESMLKRFCGVKDSGTLLPGHGGVLDRLDSINAAAPVFALGLIVAGVA